MIRRLFVGALVFTVCTAVVHAKQAKRPNVVIIYTDDQKFDSFGFINGKTHTPNIDKLARDGAYFWFFTSYRGMLL